MPKRWVLVGLVTAALAITGLTPMPASGAAAVEPGEWADTFCEAFDTWQTTAERAHDTIEGEIDNPAPGRFVEPMKNLIVKQLTAAADDAKATAAAIKRAGPPDVPNGAKIEKAFEDGLNDAAAVFTKAAKDASKFPVDEQGLQAKVKALEKQVDKALEDVGDDLSAIDKLDKKGDLDDAFNASPSCSSLN